MKENIRRQSPRKENPRFILTMVFIQISIEPMATEQKEVALSVNVTPESQHNKKLESSISPKTESARHRSIMHYNSTSENDETCPDRDIYSAKEHHRFKV